MKKCFRPLSCSKLLFIFGLIFCPSVIFAAKLQIIVRVYPASPEPSELSIKISPALGFTKGAGDFWDYATSDPIGVFETVQMTVENVKAPHKIFPLRMRLSSFKKDLTIIYLYVVSVSADAEAGLIDSMFRQRGKPPDIRLDELFQGYQIASFIAEKRLGELENRQRSFFARDAMSFVTYLELARKVGLLRNVIPDPLVARVRKYLGDQLYSPSGMPAIKKANILESDIKNLFAEIELVEAGQLRRLWDEMVSDQNSDPFSPNACRRYRGFKAKLGEFDHSTLEQWSRDNRTYNFKSSVDAALQSCIARSCSDALEAAESVLRLPARSEQEEIAYANLLLARLELENEFSLIAPAGVVKSIIEFETTWKLWINELCYAFPNHPYNYPSANSKCKDAFRHEKGNTIDEYPRGEKYGVYTSKDLLSPETLKKEKYAEKFQLSLQKMQSACRF